MKKNGTLKAGYTLVEMLTVVAIMGILAGVGVSGFQTAVQNGRIKDAGINVTAFMERAANMATRMNTTLCVKVESDNRTLKVYKGDCTGSGDEVVEQMSMDPPNKFLPSSEGTCPGDVDRYAQNKVELVPKIGVSPIPKGCFMVRYGGTDRLMASVKEQTKFSMSYMLSYNSGSSWETR